jgi:hypothetical protein
MGIFEWVKSQTGAWGPALLDAYLQNSGWINALFLAYGLVLWLSWQNLSRIQDGLAALIVEQVRAGNQAGRKKKVVHLTDFQLSWEEAAGYSRFPFIARQTGILIHRSTPENLRALISERDLLQRCASRLREIGFQIEPGK